MVAYKVTTHHEAIDSEDGPWFDVPEHNTVETRYCIVSPETGEVLDDANGYGYKSAQKARAAFSYKKKGGQKNKEVEKRKAAIKRWIGKHEPFSDLMDYCAINAWKSGEKFDYNIVEQLLADEGLDVWFTAEELFDVWGNG